MLFLSGDFKESMCVIAYWIVMQPQLSEATQKKEESKVVVSRLHNLTFLLLMDKRNGITVRCDIFPDGNVEDNILRST